METSTRLLDAIESFIARIGRGASWLSLVLVAVIMTDVVGRHFFLAGSVGLQELEWHLHATIFLFVAAYAYQENVHVRIDLLREHCSPRIRAWIEIIGCLLFLIPYSAVLCYLSYKFWKYAWDINEISDAPGGLPYRWIIKATLPIAFATLFLQGWATIGRSLLSLRQANIEERRA